MKKILKPLFCIFLVFFSFFYTDQIMNLVNKKDPLMKKINDLKEEYYVKPVSAYIEEDTIVPGISGRELDVESSYEIMKSEGVFREKKAVYKEVLPSSSISNNKDKYIIKGNSIKNEVALIYILKNKSDIEDIKTNKNITLFIDSSIIDSSTINVLKEKEIYTYGNNGKYTKEQLTSDNNIISRVSNNKSLYCLAKEKNSNTLKICNEKNMYVVIPSVVGDYVNIKKDLTSGSIILISSLNNIEIITKYINSKGYEIVYLSKLLEE